MMEAGFTNEYRNRRLAVYEQLQRWAAGHATLARFGVATLMALLTGLLAQIALYTPLTPVPYTGQVFGVALMGGLLGRKWGAISAIIYVLLGLVGVPVYAQAASGLGVFTKGLTGGYLLGFIAQAYLVGLVVDRRHAQADRRLAGFSTLSVAGLILFALLDVYFLADYARIYADNPGSFPNAWFLVLSAGLLVLIGGAAWLTFTTKARRERLELFFANIVGLLAVYALGTLWFFGMWYVLGNDGLRAWDLLRLTVLPFIPADLTKILLAVGLLTLVRPTQRELARRSETSS